MYCSSLANTPASFVTAGGHKFYPVSTAQVLGAHETRCSYIIGRQVADLESVLVDPRFHGAAYPIDCRPVNSVEAEGSTQHGQSMHRNDHGMQ